jgi:hypothetical protein
VSVGKRARRRWSDAKQYEDITAKSTRVGKDMNGITKVQMTEAMCVSNICAL